MMIRVLAIVTALALPSVALADPDKAPPADKTTDKATDKTNEKMTDKAPVKTDKDKNPKLADGDVKIIAHLHHVNQMEIEMGKLAQKTGTQAVKGYADTLVNDHTSNDKELMSFSKAHKLATIPADKPETDADRQDAKNMMTETAKLKTLKAAEFDKAFLNMMVAGHDKELAKIDTSIGASADPDLQTMLKSTKPVLQRHSDQAHDLQKNTPQAALDKPADKPTQK
jgi:predicted outer membrane protein